MCEAKKLTESEPYHVAKQAHLINQNIFCQNLVDAPPRIFKLYEELEAAEKSTQTDSTMSLGLDNTTDPTELRKWNGSIMGSIPNSQFEDRFYTIEMEAGDNYPVEPPTTKFVGQKINLPSVAADGTVNFAANSQLAQWNPSMGMMDVLKALKGEMASKKNLQQPADGANY